MQSSVKDRERAAKARGSPSLSVTLAWNGPCCRLVASEPVSCSFYQISLQRALRMLCTGPGAHLAIIGRCSIHACTHIHLVTSAPFLLFSDCQPSHLQPHVPSPENTTGCSSENLHSTPEPLLSVPRVDMQTWCAPELCYFG